MKAYPCPPRALVGTRIVGTSHDVTAEHEARELLAASEARYRELALKDPLTGLANRALFNDRLAHLFAVAAPVSRRRSSWSTSTASRDQRHPRTCGGRRTADRGGAPSAPVHAPRGHRRAARRRRVLRRDDEYEPRSSPTGSSASRQRSGAPTRSPGRPSSPPRAWACGARGPRRRQWRPCSGAPTPRCTRRRPRAERGACSPRRRPSRCARCRAAQRRGPGRGPVVDRHGPREGRRRSRRSPKGAGR